MTDQTTENFLKIFAEFEWPEPTVSSYRLYYNEDGSPKCYSMENMPDKYIEIDADTFALRPYNVRVVEGKLIRVQPSVQVQKLKPSNTGTPCHPRDVCVVVSDQQAHVTWNKTTYEIS